MATYAICSIQMIDILILNKTLNVNFGSHVQQLAYI